MFREGFLKVTNGAAIRQAFDGLNYMAMRLYREHQA